MDSIITVGISIGIAFMLFLVVYVLFYEKIKIWYYRNECYHDLRDRRLRNIAYDEAYIQESNNWNKRHHIEDKLDEGELDWIPTVDAVVQEVLEEIEEKRLRQEFNRYLIDRYLTEDDCKWDKHEITYYNIK